MSHALGVTGIKTLAYDKDPVTASLKTTFFSPFGRGGLRLHVPPPRWPPGEDGKDKLPNDIHGNIPVCMVYDGLWKSGLPPLMP
jgi:hypothetical protein